MPTVFYNGAMTVSPPVIVQHSRFYTIPARIAGKILLYAMLMPITLLRSQHKARTRALIIWGDHLLLVHNVASRGRWTLPGGGVKAGESDAEGLAREIREELAIGVAPKALQFIGRYHDNERFDKMCFALDLQGVDTQKIALSAEILEAQWFPVSQPPSNTTSFVAWALRDYQRLP